MNACTYGGDSNYVSQSATLNEVIRYSAASITLSSSLSPATVGQSTIFTAKVTGSGPMPTGGVILQDNGRQIGQVPLAADGSATFSINSLSVGSHNVQAIYSGNSAYDSQSTTLTEIVTPVPTLTALNVSPNPAFAGQIVTLKAVVTSSGNPTGSVTFFDGTMPIGSSGLDATGTSVLTTSQLQVGTHSLSATVAANLNWAGSSSSVVNEVITSNSSDYKLTDGSLTLRTEHHGAIAVTVTPIGGLSDTVSISCGSLPLYVTCQVTPSQVSINNGTPQNVTVAIDTDQIPGYASVNRHTGIEVAVLLPYLLVGLTLRRPNIKVRVILLGFLTFLTGGIMGCSGKYPLSTPPGTYSIVIHGHGQTSVRIVQLL